jgi:hypothetical protein
VGKPLLGHQPGRGIENGIASLGHANKLGLSGPNVNIEP